jgi:RimJ/RimL family protein N-acetyltransferase
MMKELEFIEYNQEANTNFPLINAVLMGLQDGLVFRDEEDDPSLFILHKSGFSYFIDKSKIDYDGILNWLVGSIKTPTYFHVYNAEQPLISFCEGKKDQINIKVRKRVQLKFKGEKNPPKEFPPPLNYSVRRINSENFKKLSIFNLELENKFWRSEMNFIDDGFGYCVFNEADLPVSICYSACIARQKAEIDVATLPQFQNKGLAKCAVNSFVNHCNENDIIANWDCFEDNLGSLRTAESIGFEQIANYDLLSIFNKTKIYEKL